MKNASHSATASSFSLASRLQLSCLASSPAAVRAAINAGADWVRVPIGPAQLTTLDPDVDRPRTSIRYVHGRGRKVALDLSDSAHGTRWREGRDAVAWAAAQGFDAIVLSDVALALFCTSRFPALPLHFVAKLEISARTAALLKLQLNASRILVPQSLSTTQLVEICTSTKMEVEILASGTKHMPNTTAQAHDNLHAAWADDPCNDPWYSSQQHLADAFQQLPLMASLGIRAIQVEPRTDMPDDVANVAHVWRSAIDRCLKDGKRFAVDPAWERQLGRKRRH